MLVLCLHLLFLYPVIFSGICTLYLFNNAQMVVKTDGATTGDSAWSHSSYLELGLGLDTCCRPHIVWANYPSCGLTARHVGWPPTAWDDLLWCGLTSRHLGWPPVTWADYPSISQPCVPAQCLVMGMQILVTMEDGSVCYQNILQNTHGGLHTDITLIERRNKNGKNERNGTTILTK